MLVTLEIVQPSEDHYMLIKLNIKCLKNINLISSTLSRILWRCEAFSQQHWSNATYFIAAKQNVLVEVGAMWLWPSWALPRRRVCQGKADLWRFAFGRAACTAWGTCTVTFSALWSISVSASRAKGFHVWQDKTQGEYTLDSINK